jgi:hypothetical protein|tara:strand:- start:422 stop:1000 length:579 start_codon:yes stop_codon:yes gene_type:complete
MSFYFRPFPKINYDVKKNNSPLLLTDITKRYKIRDILQQKAAIYYNYTVRDGDRPDLIAFKYYGDETLDWLIFLCNNMMDPYYDWPLDYRKFTAYMKSLYGSVDVAKSTVFEYRKILNEQSTLIDGTVVPKRTVVIDLNTYNSLSTSVREEIDAYQYYEELNDAKREIKLLDERFVPDIITEVEAIFSENYN